MGQTLLVFSFKGDSMLEKIGLMAAIVLPLFNIPLIVRILKRKSSEDISIPWAVGVWVCILLMAPSGFVSKDIIWRVYNIVNTVFFTGVALVVLKYHKGAGKSAPQR